MTASSSRTGGLRIAVLCPHFAPDTAPTGVVITRIVEELAARGHRLDVVTALPWYRTHAIEAGWKGWVRREVTPWGSVTRVNPFPGGDKRNLLRRAVGFAGFSLLAGGASLRGGRVDAVIAMSPPLTLGMTGWVTSVVRRGPLVFNIQDVFPDAAVETGAITDRRVIGVARWLERTSYHRAAAVTVLSDDLRDNVAGKVRPARRGDVRVIPNFVDTDAITPGDRMTHYRHELGIGPEPVVMYAGNVGFSQSLHLMLAAAAARPGVTFVINGDGAARPELEAAAGGLPNIRFAGYQPVERLGEVLATADVHVVPLKAGLARVSVPSKSYSILAAGRPLLAAIDPGTAIPRIIDRAGAGVAVPPDDVTAFLGGLDELLADPVRAEAMGRRGRAWVEAEASPAAVALAYEHLIVELGSRRGRR